MHTYYLYIYIYLFIYLFIFLYLSIYIYISTYLSIYIYIFLYVYIFIYLYIYIFIHLYIHIFRCSDIQILRYLYVSLFIYLFNYIFNLYATSDSQTLLPCLLIARFPGLHATSGHGRPIQVMRNALLRVLEIGPLDSTQKATELGYQIMII